MSAAAAPAEVAALLRRRPGRRRHGRRLPAVEAALFLPAAPRFVAELHRALCAAGFTLQPAVRPYQRHDGSVSVRLVFRQRGDGGGHSLVVEHSFAVPLRTALALLAAPQGG